MAATPSDAPGCSAGAYDDGVAGPRAAAEVPVQETCEELHAGQEWPISASCVFAAFWVWPRFTALS